MLGHLQNWQNRLLPAASDYLPTVPVVYLPVLRRQSLCRKPEHLMSVFPSFGRWERSSWKEQLLPHSLVPAKKAKRQWFARTLFMLSLPAKSYPFPSQELPGPHPSSLGSKIQLCPHTALSQLWVSASWWVRGNNSNQCQACRSSKATAVSRDLTCWECSSGYYSKSSTVSCLAKSFGVWSTVTS